MNECDALVYQLISIVKQDVNRRFNIDVSDNDILILDLSTPNKFSNHLVFQNVIFQDNKTCSDYVSLFVWSCMRFKFNIC